MFVIAGSLGNTGSVVVQSLLDAGKKVRALVRDTQAPKAQALSAKGVEVVAADLGDVEVVTRAFAGAEGVYLLSPPDAQSKDFVGDRVRFFGGLAEAVRSANVPHVVLLSSIGGEKAEGTGIIRTVHDAERILAGSGAATTFVRAAYFLENWAAVLPAARGDGVLPSFLTKDRVIPMAATRDIGKVAARALLDGPRGTRILELASVDASPADVASAVAKILGRPVTVAEAPLAAVVPAFTSFGIAPEVGELYRQMYAGINDGTIDWTPLATERVERIRGEAKLDDVLRGLLGA